MIASEASLFSERVVGKVPSQSALETYATLFPSETSSNWFTAAMLSVERAPTFESL